MRRPRTALLPVASVRALLLQILSLFVGIGLLVVGVGVLFTELGLRAELLGFPVAITGVVMSAYFLGFVLGTYLCPAVIRRAGHIRAFSAMASVASVAPLLHALVASAWAWGLLRLLTGLCLVGLYMVIESWLNVIAPNRQRGRVFAAYMAVTLVSMALGQYLILAGGVLGFAPLALVSILLSLALVPVALTRVPEPPPVPVPRPDLRRLYAVAPVGFAGALAAGLVSGAFFGMGAVFAQRVGMGKDGVAAFMSATIAGGALLQWPIGHFSDRRDRRAVLAAVCGAGVLVAGLALAAARSSDAALIGVASVYGGLMFSVYGISVAHVNDLLEPGEMLEASGGLLLVYGTGATIGPAAAGLLMGHFGPGSLLVYFALVQLATAAFAFHRWRKIPRQAVGAPSAYVPMAGSSQAVLQLDPRVAPAGNAPETAP
jgi:MFS family permease